MKNSKIIAFAAAAFLFAACDKTPDGVTNITLDQTTAELAVGQTLTLTATVEPAGAATVTWESSNTAVATVDGGVVTAVAEGSAIIAASADGKVASCIVTVVAENAGGNGGGEEPDPSTLHKSLQGSEYYIFQMDGITSAKIESKIVADFRVNETDCFLDVWSEGETYSAGTTTGLNFYGEAEGWVSFTVVAPAGWSGGGYRCTSVEKISALAKIMENPKDYYFHIAMKSTDQASHLLQINGTAGSGKVCIGSATFIDGSTQYQPVGNFTRDGSWGEIEICMQDLVNLGYATAAITSTDGTFYPFSFLSGAQPGTILQYDAAFIYKK